MWSLSSLSVAKRFEQWEHWNLWPTETCNKYKHTKGVLPECIWAEMKHIVFNLAVRMSGAYIFTFHGALSNYVVEKFCVAGVHPATAWTCHYLLLSMAAQVLPQLRTPFSSGFTIWRMTVTELLLNDLTSFVLHTKCTQPFKPLKSIYLHWHFWTLILK